MSRASLQAAPDAGRPRMAAFWLGMLPVIGIGVFIAGIALGVRGDDVSILGLAIATGLLCLVPVISDQARPAQQRHLLLSLFSLAYFMFFSFPVFTRYFLIANPELATLQSLVNIAPPDIIRGQTAALISLLLVLGAYYSPVGRVLAQALPTPRRDWSAQGALTIACVMIPMGWAVYLGSQFGLIPRRAGSGFLGTIASSYYYGIALVALVYIRYRSRPALFLLAVLIPPTMAFNFFTGSKRLFLIPWIMVVLAFLVTNRRIRIRWILAGIIALSLLYPTAIFYRNVVLVGNTKRAVEVLQDPEATIGAVFQYATSFSFSEYFLGGLRATGARTNALNMATVIIRDTPNVVPFQNGRTLGYIFIAFIPRIIWANKPSISIGQWITDNYGGGPSIRSQTGPSWIGELYMNFGWAGIIGGMLFAGLYFRVLHEWLFRPRATIPALFFGIVALWSLGPRLGGQIISLFTFVVFYGTPILAAHLLVQAFFPRPAPRREEERPREFAADGRIEA